MSSGGGVHTMYKSYARLYVVHLSVAAVFPTRARLQNLPICGDLLKQLNIIFRKRLLSDFIWIVCLNMA